MIQQVLRARTPCLLGFMVASSVGFSPKKAAGVGAAQAVLAEVPGDLHSTAVAPLEQGTETSSVHLGPSRLPSPISGWDPLHNPSPPPQKWSRKREPIVHF